MTDEGPKYGLGVIGVSDRKLSAAACEGRSCTRFEQALKVLEHSEALTPHLVGVCFALDSSGSSNRTQHHGSPCNVFELSVIAVLPALYLEIVQNTSGVRCELQLFTGPAYAHIALESSRQVNSIHNPNIWVNTYKPCGAAGKLSTNICQPRPILDSQSDECSCLAWCHVTEMLLGWLLSLN